MKSKIAIPNNPSSWLFNQKAERNQMNRQKSKSTFTTTLLALMLALLLGGAGFLGSPAAAQEPQYGGSITFLDGYGAQWPPTGWDPAIGIWTVQNWVEPYLETLLAADYEKYGPRGTNEAPFQISQGNPLTMLKGRLAESWSLPDANTIIYKIRQGIMWGEVPGVMKSRELTAQDVVSSLLRNMNEEIARNGFGARYYKVMESMTAKDRYTIEIKLENFIADWWLFYGYAVWAGAGIIPPELLTAGSNDWKNHRGIGTGPFFPRGLRGRQPYRVRKEPQLLGLSYNYQWQGIQGSVFGRLSENSNTG